MKKLYIIILALILSLAMIVPMTIPVAADPPTDTKKPVSWVTGASNGNKTIPHSISMALVVKQLSDGSTVGHVESHIFSDKITWNCDDFISSSFSGNVAEFEGYFYCKQTETTWREKWVLFDNGEPGMFVDGMIIWIDLDGDDVYDVEIPMLLCSGNVQVHVGN